MFLAAIMLGWPLVMAGGRVAGAPTVIATLNADQISESITAEPGAPTDLIAKSGDAQVALSWAAPASDGGASIIGYSIYQRTSPDAESSTPVPRSDITGCTDTATAGSCTVTALVDGTAYYFRVAAVNDFDAVGPMSNEASAIPSRADRSRSAHRADRQRGRRPGDAGVGHARIEWRSASYQL